MGIQISRQPSPVCVFTLFDAIASHQSGSIVDHRIWQSFFVNPESTNELFQLFQQEGFCNIREAFLGILLMSSLPPPVKASLSFALFSPSSGATPLSAREVVDHSCTLSYDDLFTLFYMALRATLSTLRIGGLTGFDFFDLTSPATSLVDDVFSHVSGPGFCIDMETNITLALCFLVSLKSF